MDVSFGTRLRLHREQQGVDLAAIAEDTKIKRSLLEELERDDVSHWPDGIFRRAYMRSYARAIGLDAEAVVREFLTLFPDPAEEFLAEPVPQEQSRLRRLVSSALGVRPRAPESVSRERRSEPEYEPEPSLERLMADSVPETETEAETGPVLTLEMASDLETEPASAIEPVRFIAPPPVPEHESLHYSGREIAATADDVPAGEPACPGNTLVAAAALCTRLGRAAEEREVLPILAEAARLLDASGLTLWSWDPLAMALRALLAHGYPVTALPPVRTDAANAIASAFRTGETCVVEGGAGERGAMVVPMVGPGGCAVTG